MNWFIIVYHDRIIGFIVAVPILRIVIVHRPIVFIHRQIRILSIPIPILDRLHQFLHPSPHDRSYPKIRILYSIAIHHRAFPR